MSLHEPCDCRGEIRRRTRFGQEEIAPRAFGAISFAIERECGERDDWNVARHLRRPQSLRYFPAIDAGQQHVQQNDIRAIAKRQLQSFFAGRGLGHTVPETAEVLTVHMSCVFEIIDQENQRAECSGGRRHDPCAVTSSAITLTSVWPVFADNDGVLRCGALLLGLSLAWAQPAIAPARFHHVHFTENWSLGFYERLFDPAVIERSTLWGFDALRIGNLMFLASKGKTGPQSERSAVWHYGWGAASLRESYIDHNLREVAWDPPLPPNGFHLHLESVTPIAAATWYREHFGARTELAPDLEPVADRDQRRPMALVRIGTVAMLFYKSDQPLASTLGKQVDHLAFAVEDLTPLIARLMAAEVTVLEPPHHLEDVVVAMIEGPDRLAIELVEIKSP
jgi:hypothetical protein